jgi:hypothetical protein
MLVAPEQPRQGHAIDFARAGRTMGCHGQTSDYSRGFHASRAPQPANGVLSRELDRGGWVKARSFCCRSLVSPHGLTNHGCVRVADAACRGQIGNCSTGAGAAPPWKAASADASSTENWDAGHRPNIEHLRAWAVPVGAYRRDHTKKTRAQHEPFERRIRVDEPPPHRYNESRRMCRPDCHARGHACECGRMHRHPHAATPTCHEFA